MNVTKLRNLTASIFLGLAYLFVVLQWLWILALGLPSLVETGVFESLTPPQQTEQPAPVTPSEFSPVLTLLAGIITLVFLALTVVILIKIPKTISQTGDKIIHQTTEAIIPVITHHKKITKQKKYQLSQKITAAMQLALLLLPLIIAFFVPPIQTITSQIITTLAVWLATVSLACFVLGWLLKPRATSRTRSRESRG